MKKRAVVTGATGYIGSNLLKYLLVQGWDISIISKAEFGYDNINSIKSEINVFEYNDDINTLISFFQENDFDVVFHLAAAVISNPKPEQISSIIQSNIQFGVEVLEAMKYSSTRLFINTGSYWQNYNSDTYNPVDLYSATKEAFEKIIQYYADAHHYRIITLRLFDIYGENDKRPKLLNLLCSLAKDKSSLDISPGEQYLDFVHISDVCTAYLKAYELLLADDNVKNEIYGVYTGLQIQLKSMIQLFERKLGMKLNINYGNKPYREREVMKPISSYKKLPNWTHVVDIESGISRIINNSNNNI